MESKRGDVFTYIKEKRNRVQKWESEWGDRFNSHARVRMDCKWGGSSARLSYTKAQEGETCKRKKRSRNATHSQESFLWLRTYLSE